MKDSIDTAKTRSNSQYKTRPFRPLFHGSSCIRPSNFICLLSVSPEFQNIPTFSQKLNTQVQKKAENWTLLRFYSSLALD